MDSNMIKRVSFAAVAIPVLVAVVWFGSWPLAIVLAVAGVLAMRELFAMVSPTGVQPFVGTGTVLAMASPLLICLARSSGDLSAMVLAWWPLAILGVIVWTIGIAVFTRAPDARPLAAVAVTLMAIAYVVVLPMSLFYMRHALWSPRSWAGAAVVFFPLVITWVCDSAAMFGGRIFGGPKLAPRVSPGKTRSGGVAGVVGGAVIALVYALLIFPRAGVSISPVMALLMGAVLAAVGQVGDLAESLFKREAGVKDSSTLIPGHGGVLDRLDSLYFVLPVATILYRALGVL